MPCMPVRCITPDAQPPAIAMTTRLHTHTHTHTHARTTAHTVLAHRHSLSHSFAAAATHETETPRRASECACLCIYINGATLFGDAYTHCILIVFVRVCSCTCKSILRIERVRPSCTHTHTSIASLSGWVSIFFSLWRRTMH